MQQDLGYANKLTGLIISSRIVVDWVVKVENFHFNSAQSKTRKWVYDFSSERICLIYVM
jgi:hypothetical protein